MRAIIVALLLGAAGCASGVDGVRQGIATTASTVSLGYRALAKFDELKQAAIVLAAKSGHLAEAEADYVGYKAKRDIAIKALDGAAAVVEAANAAIPLIERGVAKDKNAGAWVQDLLAAGLRVVEVLGTMGVKIGGG